MYILTAKLNDSEQHIALLIKVSRVLRIEQSFIAFELPQSNCLPLTVQPVPTPPSIQVENTNNSKLGGNSQKLMLLSLGNR